MARDYPAKSEKRRQGGRLDGRLNGRDGAGGRRSAEPVFRLFIAVDIPPQAAAGLVAWQERYLRPDRAIRMSPEGQMHVTLIFLGNLKASGRDRAAAALDCLEGLCSFDAAATELIGLPRHRRPRVIAAAIEEHSGRLAEAHGRLAVALEQEGLFKPEKRPYLPHVTIARVKGKTALEPDRFHPEPVKFTAVRVTLYNSILKREGASHEALKSVQLI